MIPSLLYRIAHFLAMNIPLTVSYAIAAFLADMFFVISVKDRNVVIKNTRIVCGDLPGGEILRMSRDVFRNFAKYLIDFLRFEKIDDKYMKAMFKIKGRENIDLALARGKGVILLSAHIGNWELGGAFIASMGYDINVVALPHSHKGINDFFRRQRGIVNVKGIEIGSALKGCYKVLKSNGLLALLGDRDFTKNGQLVEFFGHNVFLPLGPAALCHRIDPAIVPCFLVREPDDTFTMHMDPAIYSDQSLGEEKDTERLMKACAGIIEGYVRRYPTQWYVFKDIWNGYGKDLRPDTII